MNDTSVCIVGNITDDPTLRFSPGGDAVANFKIMSTPRRWDRQAGDYRDLEPIALRCTAWKGLAENVATTLTKGMRVVVRGEMRSKQWEDRDGNKRESLELDVDAVGPDLRFATAAVTKVGKPAGRGVGWNEQAQGSDPWGEGGSDAPF